MEKNPNVSGVMYFKPMLFKGQLYSPSYFSAFLVTLNNLPSAVETAIPLLGMCLREMKTRRHRNLYANVHGSVIHSSQKGKTAQRPGSWRIG